MNIINADCTMFIRRKITEELKILSNEFPVVAILGPRQSGKTTLSGKVFPNHRYVSLEDPDEREFATLDPRGFLNKYNRKVIMVYRNPFTLGIPATKSFK